MEEKFDSLFIDSIVCLFPTGHNYLTVDADQYIVFVD